MYYWFAKRFHWTSEQVDEESAVRLDALRMIGEVEDEVVAAAKRNAGRPPARGAT